MITWADGLERAPDGAPLREIVQPAVWSSGAWIDPDGTAYRRYYNASTRAWGAFEPMPLALDADGVHFGYHLSTGWTSIETCIATAWLRREPGSRARVRVIDASRAPTLDNLAWGESEQEAAVDLAGERWAPLRWQVGRVVCDPRYAISTHGRLRAADGRVTRGFAARVTRWAAVRGAGLVDLWMAAGLVRAERKVPERLYQAYLSLSACVPVAEHAARHGLALATAWAYYNRALPLVHDHGRCRALVPADLWAALEAMRGGARLGGPLRELHPEVARRLGRVVPMDLLRFARACVV